MSGRGCTIFIKVLGGSLGNGEVEDLSLPVALHSPLIVLKEQLMSIVGIPTQAQVLILCDLTDPDRNSDVLLTGRDDTTLRACGIRNGSTLTLHALGISAELKQKLTRDAMATKKVEAVSTVPRHVLNTPISAAEANHSYNGVIFDVESYGPFEVDLQSVSIAGMLGRVRIYARDRPWEDDQPRAGPSPHWWAHRESVSPDGWELVADKVCWPSWDKPIEIRFDKPVRLLPHTSRALYCHSGLPDDLGIQYQSYKKSDVVAVDDHIVIRPGLGHTGAEPFDETHGWYRAYRALAGALTYAVRRKGWSPFEHKIFPAPLKEAVLSLLMCQNQDHFLRSKSSSGPNTPVDHQRSVEPMSPSGSSNHKQLQRDREEEGPVLKISAADPSYVPPFRVQQPSALLSSLCGTGSSSALTATNHSHSRSQEVFGDGRADAMAAEVMQQLREACRGRRISELPVFVIYHILEYLHWDWFEEQYEFDTDATPCTPGAQAVSKRSRKLSEQSEASAGGSAQSARSLLYQLLAQVGGGNFQGGASGIPGLQDLLNYHYSGGGTGAQMQVDSEEDDESYYDDGEDVDFDDDEGDSGDDEEEDGEEDDEDDDGEEEDVEHESGEGDSSAMEEEDEEDGEGGTASGEDEVNGDAHSVLGVDEDVVPVRGNSDDAQGFSASDDEDH